MKLTDDIVEWLIQSGALAALFAFLWAYTKPFLTAKAKTAKTEQSHQLWTMAEQVAEAAVNTMANRNMSGAEKYNKAVDMVQKSLAEYGHHITPEVARAVVQSAYQKSGLASQPCDDITDAPGVTDGQPAQGTVAAIDPKEV